jgi:hypothetical protein
LAIKGYSELGNIIFAPPRTPEDPKFQLLIDQKTSSAAEIKKILSSLAEKNKSVSTQSLDELYKFIHPHLKSFIQQFLIAATNLIELYQQSKGYKDEEVQKYLSEAYTKAKEILQIMSEVITRLEEIFTSEELTSIKMTIESLSEEFGNIQPPQEQTNLQS